MNYEPIIGLEVHVQLKTQSKMFCRNRNAEATEPNLHICEICTGQPGALPVINMEAVRKSVMVGLALNCQIAEYSKFDRKNYFYPDLPKGYQISQFDHPINGKGRLGTVGITRAHLEEDAGKLVHPPGKDYSLVDLNRAGTPLLEIVSEPDIRSAEQAKAYLQELQNIMRYLGVSDADMEKGHLRCDANISLRKIGEKGFPPYKVEVKNMNSFRAVERAINFEIKRQAEMLDQGERPKMETRGWVDEKGITVSQRSKEESQDYRYFPEPDLPVLQFTREWLDELRRELPELPNARKTRFVEEYKIPEKDADVLVGYKDLADYFEHVVSEFSAEGGSASGGEASPKQIQMIVSWILGPFLAAVNEKGILPSDSKVKAENFAELLKLIGDGKVSNLAAKDVFAKMFETGEDPHVILDRLGLHQVSDEGMILDAVKKAIEANPKAVADAKANPKSIGFLVGAAMKELKGKGNPQMINEILKKELKND